ncbi:outer membrane beta-barrel protein [Labilibaculum antarcticum]|uniref:Uncharacterized protein n=1 Tax=Labilibaculum antarcticum TaxID=1717717 RepID=A0A1Y1CKN6_9BACT|nr:outer membrane beta-barrel protein [Labilibaculum antarcticum]BAX79831.1 hypothetical protein ALGA_1452 [Labilibaculum antarcticum]
MIKHILILLLTLSYLTLTAQEFKGQLIDNDGASKKVYLLDPYKKSNYESILFYRYGQPTKLYASDYRRAVFSDDLIYTSIKVEESNEKVWAQLHFESELIKLYLRYNNYYLETNNQVMDISKSQNLESLQLPDQLKKRWGQALKESKSLPFKKVKTILKEYHKQEKIKYRSYFNKRQSSMKIEVEVGIGLNVSKANINKSNTEQFRVNIISPRLFANCRIYLPRVMENSFAGIGISILKYSMEEDIHKRFANSDNYYESEMKFLQVAIPLSFNMKIASLNNFDIYAKAGAKIYFNIGDNGTLNTEYKIENIVRPEQQELQLAKKDGLAPIAGFLIDKKFGKQQFSLSLQYEHYMESGASSTEIPEVVLNNSAITIGLAMKF